MSQEADDEDEIIYDESMLLSIYATDRGLEHKGPPVLASADSRALNPPAPWWTLKDAAPARRQRMRQGLAKREKQDNRGVFDCAAFGCGACEVPPPSEPRNHSPDVYVMG